MKTKDNAHFHIILVIGVIEKDGKFLLGKRSDEELQMPGEWMFPGGKVEKVTDKEDDILINTLKKEIMEEVGVKIEDNLP